MSFLWNCCYVCCTFCGSISKVVSRVTIKNKTKLSIKVQFALTFQCWTCLHTFLLRSEAVSISTTATVDKLIAGPSFGVIVKHWEGSTTSSWIRRHQAESFKQKQDRTLQWWIYNSSHNFRWKRMVAIVLLRQQKGWLSTNGPMETKLAVCWGFAHQFSSGRSPFHQIWYPSTIHL